MGATLDMHQGGDLKHLLGVVTAAATTRYAWWRVQPTNSTRFKLQGVREFVVDNGASTWPYACHVSCCITPPPPPLYMYGLRVAQTPGFRSLLLSPDIVNLFVTKRGVLWGGLWRTRPKVRSNLSVVALFFGALTLLTPIVGGKGIFPAPTRQIL